MIKNKKIIISIVISIILIGAGVYAFVTEDKTGTMDVNQIVSDEENIEEDTNEEIYIPKNIVVHITGEVNKPGVITLEEGSRIADAIEKAGGAKKDADLNKINLAYLLEDGVKIYIPNKNDTTNEEYITKQSGDNNLDKDNKGVNGKVNINTATQSELENLPGIGASIANRIIEYREQNGKFQKIEDLQNVKGIGDAKYNNIKEYITIK